MSHYTHKAFVRNVLKRSRSWQRLWKGRVFDDHCSIRQQSVNSSLSKQTSSLFTNPKVICVCVSCHRQISSGKLGDPSTFDICTHPPPPLPTHTAHLHVTSGRYRTVNKTHAPGLKCHRPKQGPVNTSLTFLSVYPCRKSGLVVKQNGLHTEKSWCARRWRRRWST